MREVLLRNALGKVSADSLQRTNLCADRTPRIQHAPTARRAGSRGKMDESEVDWRLGYGQTRVLGTGQLLQYTDGDGARNIALAWHTSTIQTYECIHWATGNGRKRWVSYRSRKTEP